MNRRDDIVIKIADRADVAAVLTPPHDDSVLAYRSFGDVAAFKFHNQGFLK